MDNFLPNGAVLPSGLLSDSYNAMSGFNKTYKNYPLRVGMIERIFPVGDPNNRTGLTTEYDVLVLEQKEDESTVPIHYRNCLSSEGMGSIADFFEKTLRVQQKLFKVGTPGFVDQDGAIVLLLCLDGVSEKGIIISCLIHPKRDTTLTSDKPYLEGEYNGVNIKVNTDGSAKLTFNGATDNEGKALDESQALTEVSIEKDGSIQAKHDKITLRLDRNGNTTLTTSGDVSVSAGGNASVKASGEATIDAEVIKLNGDSGQLLSTVTDEVVDTVFGEPTRGIPTVKGG